MLAEALARIEKEKKGAKKDSLEAGVALMLTELCRQDKAVAAALAQTDRTLSGCAKHLTDYAQKHKSGSAYTMTPAMAEKLIRAYYNLGEAGPAVEPVRLPAPPAAGGANINILDLL